MEKREDTELKKKIEEFKRKANRPYAWNSDVEKLLNACGGSVELAVETINR